MADPLLPIKADEVLRVRATRDGQPFPLRWERAEDGRHIRCYPADGDDWTMLPDGVLLTLDIVLGEEAPPCPPSI